MQFIIIGAGDLDGIQFRGFRPQQPGIAIVQVSTVVPGIGHNGKVFFQAGANFLRGIAFRPVDEDRHHHITIVQPRNETASTAIVGIGSIIHIACCMHFAVTGVGGDPCFAIPGDEPVIAHSPVHFVIRGFGAGTFVPFQFYAVPDRESTQSFRGGADHPYGDGFQIDEIDRLSVIGGLEKGVIGLFLNVVAYGWPEKGSGDGIRANGRVRIEPCRAVGLLEWSAGGRQFHHIPVGFCGHHIHYQGVAGFYAGIHDRMDHGRVLVFTTDNGDLHIAGYASDLYPVPVFLHKDGNIEFALQGWDHPQYVAGYRVDADAVGSDWEGVSRDIKPTCTAAVDQAVGKAVAVDVVSARIMNVHLIGAAIVDGRVQQYGRIIQSQEGIDGKHGFNVQGDIHRIGDVHYPEVPVGVFHADLISARGGIGVPGLCGSQFRDVSIYIFTDVVPEIDLLRTGEFGHGTIAPGHFQPGPVGGGRCTGVGDHGYFIRQA